MTSSQVFCLLALFVSATIAGSAIHMTSSPATIKPLLTSQLTLKCELTKVKVTNNAHNTDLPHDCNVTLTSEDVDVINSIMITTEAGKEVASVTEKKQPRLLLDDDDDDDDGNDDDVVVTGELTGGAGGDTTGFLQVTWPHPSDKQADTYICEVNTLNKKGHGIGFKTALKIEAATPTISDMIGHINSLTKEIKQQSTKLQLQDVKLADMEKRFGHVETGTQSFYIPRDSFSSSDTYLYNKVANGRSWTMRYKDTTVAFSKPYTTPPSITWSLGFLQDERKYLMYSVDLMSVSTKSFTLRVGVFNPDVHGTDITDWMFDDLVLQWTSIPK